MDIEKVKELIKAVSDSELTAFEYCQGDVKVALCKKGGSISGNYPQINEKSATSIEDNNVKNQEILDDLKQEVVEESFDNIVEIKSPLVGTVYVSPTEDGEPFVKQGDKVKKGQVVVIVEAMKLMNEIESEFDGVIKEVLVENGQTVEYGQTLFTVER